jgi:hypothetical protein
MAELLFIGVVVESETICSDRCGHFRPVVPSEIAIGVCGRCKLFGEFLMSVDGPDWTPPARARRFAQCQQLAEALVLVRAKNAWHDWTDADEPFVIVRAWPLPELPRLSEADLQTLRARGFETGLDDDDLDKHQFMHICHEYPGKALCQSERLWFHVGPITAADLQRIDCAECIRLFRELTNVQGTNQPIP